MDNIIKVEKLNINFEKFSLSDVSFSVPEGCIAGFIGLNGQGKTTTIRSLLGLSKKISGKIEILGKDFTKFENEIKDEIGVVFDEGYLYDSLKIKQMKSIVSDAYSKWDDNKYHQLINKFNLDENQFR